MAEVYDHSSREGRVGNVRDKLVGLSPVPSPGAAVAPEHHSRPISTGGRELRFRPDCVGIAGNTKSALENMAGDGVHGKLKFGPFELSSGEKSFSAMVPCFPLAAGRSIF